MRTILHLCCGISVMLLFGGLISGCSRGADSGTVEKQPDALALLESAQASSLQPSGDLADMFILGSDFTELQREIKLKEIRGKIVEWRLPVYEVSKVGDVYQIQTSSGMQRLGNESGPDKKLVRAFVYITLRKDEERRKIEAIKTGDWVAFKGVIADVTMRILEIRPAILATNNAILTKAEKIAAMANRKNEQLDWEVASYLDSEEGWHAFLKDHEDSDSAKYARRNIKRARAEAEAARRPIPDDATRRQWQVAADKVVTTMLPGTTFKDCPDCPMMVIIPAGNYQMGEKWLTRFYGDLGSSGEGPKENITSEPVHVVTFALPFAMGQTEVTNAQWRSIMGTEPLGSIALDEKCDDECPVSSASWTDVQKFIVRLNAKTGKSYRLPSEAEWEYSCRAGKREKYCGSNNLDEVAWHSGNSQKRNAVAVKKANAFGLYDMSGSVMEWVQDCTNSSYDGAPSDGSAWQAGDCEMRMARGGASNFGASELNPAIRHPLSNSGWPVVGFRLARSLR